MTWYLLTLLIVFLGIMAAGFVTDELKGGEEHEDQPEGLARNE
jgi:hypothetical protein